MVYIGSSVNIIKRRKEHLWSAANGRPGCFYKALREFGPEAFDLEVLERCEPDALGVRERFWMAFFNATAPKSGFNISTDPYDSPGGRGGRLSEVTLARMRLAQSNVSAETRAKISAAKKGKPGRKMSEQRKAAMSLLHKTRPRRKWTEEEKARASAIKMGKVVRPEVREKIRATLKGRVFSDAHRAALTGKKISPETIRKRLATRRANKELRSSGISAPLQS
jgi:group I intron endonuclease